MHIGMIEMWNEREGFRIYGILYFGFQFEFAQSSKYFWSSHFDSCPFLWFLGFTADGTMMNDISLGWEFVSGIFGMVSIEDVLDDWCWLKEWYFACFSFLVVMALTDIFTLFCSFTTGIINDSWHAGFWEFWNNYLWIAHIGGMPILDGSGCYRSFGICHSLFQEAPWRVSLNFILTLSCTGWMRLGIWQVGWWRLTLAGLGAPERAKCHIVWWGVKGKIQYTMSFQ